MNMNQPTIYIVDLQPVLYKHLENSNKYSRILQYYPLKEIIEDILQSDYYVDYGSLVWENIHKKIPDSRHDEILSDDYSQLDLFIEELIEDLDKCILNSITINLEIEKYVLEKWVDNTSVMLILRSKYRETINYV